MHFLVEKPLRISRTSGAKMDPCKHTLFHNQILCNKKQINVIKSWTEREPVLSQTHCLRKKRHSWFWKWLCLRENLFKASTDECCSWSFHDPNLLIMSLLQQTSNQRDYTTRVKAWIWQTENVLKYLWYTWKNYLKSIMRKILTFLRFALSLHACHKVRFLAKMK